MNSLQKNILEEIKDLVTEGEDAARGMLVSTYFRVGTIILENDLTIATVANYLGRSPRSIYYMVAFARKPEIADKLTKNMHWRDVVRTYLTTPKELKAHEHDPITICKTCHKRLE